MSDKTIWQGHIEFWLNKHFCLYGECHTALREFLGEALFLL